MSSVVKRFGLAGMPVSQSKSPALFHAAYHGKYKYELFPATMAAEAMRLFHAHGLLGMNVTMPLKEQVLPFMASLSEDAALLQAVNTVVLQQDALRGYNTDVQGVAGALAEAGVTVGGRRCVVLGAGGAGRAAACALAHAGATLAIANRTTNRAEAAAQLFRATALSLTDALQHSDGFDVIINTLPAAADVAAHLHLKSQQAVLDADYANKPLQALCRNAGATYIDGSRWLLHQAIPAYRLFTGEEPDVKKMLNLEIFES
ncbi:MAG: saccharopine dehydrogenase NADP-binding domain-containing protein [Prevotellaceae bacterium]|jgi:shikimate dehydrogenase|nr:saccharopine dehydrogenase NADP-binding domain-containing protein [Prevotellaceae bacterium]